MALPEYMENRISEAVGENYGRFMADVESGAASREKLEKAMKEVTKELVRKASRKNIIFKNYSENAGRIDDRNPDRIYSEVVSRVSPSNVYANGINKAINTGLWLLFFPLVGVAKLLYYPAKYATREAKGWAMGEPSAGELLNLKDAAEYFYNAYSR